MKSENIYQKQITFKSIIAITVPTIFMTLIQASYSMIDGMFISNILGAKALSALTLISPYFNFFIAIGALFASGGSAVVMRKMGENKTEEARSDFTTLTYTIGSGKANLAMISSLIGGVTNILFDFLMIKVWNMGMCGAAIASGLGILVPCIILAYNFIDKKNLLHFSVLKFDLKVLLKTMSNGVSEFASNLISGIVMMLFNARMLSIAGADGVAASTITFYVFGIMSALYIGYMLGVSPLLSYFYGAEENSKLKQIKNISIVFISVIAVLTTILSITCSKILVSAFAQKGSSAYIIAVSGNKLFSLALLLVGINTFSSMLFTALSNGKISAIIAFSRTFVFLTMAIILLPCIWGINGLWFSVPVSEFLAFILSTYYIKKYQKEYNY